MEFFLKLVTDVGFPIAGCCAAGFFVFKMMQFILGTVVKSVQGLTNMIGALDARVRVINIEIVRIDEMLSKIIDVKPDEEIKQRLHDERSLVRKE
jgi:hypothetical protein